MLVYGKFPLKEVSIQSMRALRLGREKVVGVVGGSGFVGSAISEFLLKTDDRYEVIVLDIKQPSVRLSNRLSFQYCDVRDSSQVFSFAKEFDLLIYAAIIQIPQIDQDPEQAYNVNILGLQNACEAVKKSQRARGLLLTGSWHVFGEYGLRGRIDEDFGFRPYKVEERARLYALHKVAQETIVRTYGYMSEKAYGVIRLGTVLGEGMPEKTAANIFIEQAINNKPITPYSHSAYRPMLYVDIRDVCTSFYLFSKKIFEAKNPQSLSTSINLCWPKPITIIELAELVKKTVAGLTNNMLNPEVKIVETGQLPIYSKSSAKGFRVNVEKAKSFLGMRKLTSPKASLSRIIRKRLVARGYDLK